MLIHTLMSTRSLQFTEIAFLTLQDPYHILTRSLPDLYHIPTRSLPDPHQIPTISLEDLSDPPADLW